MIDCRNLSYAYRSFDKAAGLIGTLKDFRKRQYKDIKAVDQINLTINKGDIIGLLGPNGAGKTTLIKLMTGILEPTHGSLTCGGYQPFQREHPYLRSIGLLLGQKSQLLWDLPPEETLKMLQVIYRIPLPAYQQRLEQMLSLLNIQGKRYTPTRKLSLGERVKFELICALIHQPQILFLDEPTIGLDITSQRVIHQFLLEINQSFNTTIVLTSHYLKDIEGLTNRVAILLKGQLALDTSISALKKEHQQAERIVIDFQLGSRPFSSPQPPSIPLTPTSVELLATDYHSHYEGLNLANITNINHVSPSIEEIIFQIFNEAGSDHD